VEVERLQFGQVSLGERNIAERCRDGLAGREPVLDLPLKVPSGQGLQTVVWIDQPDPTDRSNMGKEMNGSIRLFRFTLLRTFPVSGSISWVPKSKNVSHSTNRRAARRPPRRSFGSPSRGSTRASKIAAPNPTESRNAIAPR
jgi:hypothetical protein